MKISDYDQIDYEVFLSNMFLGFLPQTQFLDIYGPDLYWDYMGGKILLM